MQPLRNLFRLHLSKTNYFYSGKIVAKDFLIYFNGVKSLPEMCKNHTNSYDCKHYERFF